MEDSRWLPGCSDYGLALSARAILCVSKSLHSQKCLDHLLQSCRGIRFDFLLPRAFRAVFLSLDMHNRGTLRCDPISPNAIPSVRLDIMTVVEFEVITKAYSVPSASISRPRSFWRHVLPQSSASPFTGWLSRPPLVTHPRVNE